MIKKKFTEEEDSKIIQLVKQNGARNWGIIAKSVPGRSGRQCRDRYQNYLCPGFFNGQWTKEEDELLHEKFNLMGCKWSKMMEFFPKRSANSLRNRWNYFMRKNRNEQKEYNESIIKLNYSKLCCQNYKQYYISNNTISGNNYMQYANANKNIENTLKNDINYQQNEIKIINFANANTQTDDSSFKNDDVNKKNLN